MNILAAFVLSLLLIFFLRYLLRRKVDKEEIEDVEEALEHSSDTLGVRLTFLSTYYLAVFADWLQGPNVYFVFSAAGFSHDKVILTYVLGYSSSFIFGTFVAGIADRFGRKRLAIGFCLLYGFSFLIISSLGYIPPELRFPVVIFAKISSGIATSILFSVFEAWLVTKATSKNFLESELSMTFSYMTIGSSTAAILAGIVSSVATSYFGPGGAFIVGFVVLMIDAVLIGFLWDENYGDCELNPFETMKNAASHSVMNPRILSLGLAQSLFEASMYIFVVLWTPALTPDDPETKISHGMVFSTFMTWIFIGSSMFEFAVSSTLSTFKFGIGVHLLSAVSLFLSAYFYEMKGILIVSFFLFELCCGCFWPTHGTLRARLIPSQSRSAVMNVMRIPLNLMVITFLFTASHFEPFTLFVLASGALLLSAVSIAFCEFKEGEPVRLPSLEDLTPLAVPAIGIIVLTVGTLVLTTAPTTVF